MERAPDLAKAADDEAAWLAQHPNGAYPEALKLRPPRPRGMSKGAKRAADFESRAEEKAGSRTPVDGQFRSHGVMQDLANHGPTFRSSGGDYTRPDEKRLRSSQRRA